MNPVTRLLPQKIRAPLYRAKQWVRIARHAGRGRHCPVCGHESRRFRDYGNPPRAEAECTWCGSLERHRMVWSYLKNNTDLFDGREKRVLHIAPEGCFEPRLKDALGAGYITGDLLRPKAMVKLDICDLPFKDGWFDVVLCSHVLEHIPDDRKAMRELRRVLNPAGWSLLLVPMFEGLTQEDPTITDPKERLRVYGQSDHVRRYGHDFPARLQECGFDVTTVRATDPRWFSEADIARMKLSRKTQAQLCKPRLGFAR